MCWTCYMADEARPFALDTARAARLAPLLRALVDTMLRWRPADG
jgi:hypothetical protein